MRWKFQILNRKLHLMKLKHSWLRSSKTPTAELQSESKENQLRRNSESKLMQFSN